ncbi:unnamed protein product [Ixodes hexagonus]
MTTTHILYHAENCQVRNKAHLRQKLDALFRNLPKEYLVSGTKTELLSGAIFFGEGTVSGLDEFKPDIPYYTFCRGNDMVTMFRLNSRYPLRMTIPWRTCSGQNGTVVTSADRVRYEGELVTSTTQNGTESKIDNLMPVVMESINVGMTGGGDTGNIVAVILGFVCSRPFRVFWTESVTFTVEDTLNQALRELK